MDMQSAGRGLVGAVSHMNCLLQDVFPVYAAHVVIKCHRVSYDLKPFVKAAVTLAVDVLASDIRLLLDSGSTFIVFAGTVNLQFDTKIAVPVSVKDRFGFVGIVLNLSFDTIIAA